MSFNASGALESSTPGRPDDLNAIEEDAVVHLDVRPDLREGREPFSRIMAAYGEVPEGGALTVRASFEPVPLYRVMGSKGFAHWTEQLGAEDWRVWFYPAPREAAGDRAGAPARERAGPPVSREPEGEARAGSGFAPRSTVTLDVRGLEPPEPMVRTLAALEELAPGQVLIQVNVRVPRFLLPKLEERGFGYEILEESEDRVRLAIRRKDTT